MQSSRGPREIAHSLRDSAQRERAEQAQQLCDLVALAEAYEVPFGEPHLLQPDDIPGIGRVQVGGDGCPLVSEFLADEVAGILGLSRRHAIARIGEALNLRYRHPALWAGVQELRLDAARARRAATLCEHLDSEVACDVGDEWLRIQHGLSWTAAFTRLEELIKDADPETAAAHEEAWLRGRDVTLSRPRDGVAVVRAQVDVLDGTYFDASIDEMADILATLPEYAGIPKQELRSKAVGVLAIPAYALALQQQALQPALVGESREHPKPPTDFLTEHDPHALPGHKCGVITQPVEKLQPKIQLVIHLNAHDAGCDPVARIEHAGTITTQTLKTLLGDKQVNVRPVIDLAELPDEDHYRPSTTLREAVQLTWQYEAAPFSTRRSRGKRIDLDHSVAYLKAGPPGQTSLANLTPLGRKMHRAKTLGIWTMRRPGDDPQIVEWTSPLGFRYKVTPQGTYRLN